MSGRFFRRSIARPLARVSRPLVRATAQTARRTFNNTARAIAETNPVTAQLVADYEAQLRSDRAKRAAATRKANKEAKSQSEMQQAGDFRSMSSAPVTVGMKIKRPPLTTQESGVYDSKVVSASEVLFSSITSTNNEYSGGSQTQEMLLNPLYPSLKILADEAKNFQLFRFTKASVVYESTSNSTIGGSVVLGQLSDVIDTAPDNYDDAVLLKDTIQANVWQSVSLPLDLDKEFRYISYGPSGVTNAEVRQVNQAKIFFGLVNTATSAGAVGNIKLEYTVELSKRVNGTELTSFDQFGYLMATPATALTSITNIAPNSKVSSWFVKDATNGRLLIMPKATYVFNFTLASSADEDVATPGLLILPYSPSGTPLTLIADYPYAGYIASMGMNTNLLTRMYTFKTSTLASYIDFTPIAGLTGPIDINVSIDILT